MLSATASLVSNPIPFKISSIPHHTTSTSRVKSRPIHAFATATNNAYASTESLKATSFLSHPRGNSSLYDVLGIPTGASFQEVKSAYRRLARVFHPDVASMDRRDSSTDEFLKIQAAYSTLSDPEKRADYDRKILLRYRRPLTTASGFSGYTSRNWETDQCW